MTLNPTSADWRWGLRRTTSPWYPTMTLFRQTAFGRWEDPVAEVAKRLAGLRGA